jgi:hypothetical protein
MKDSKVDIRAARPADVPTIHDFITQLAIFEKCPDQVSATHDAIARTLGLEAEPTEDETAIGATGFKPGQFAKCVIAYIDNEKAGFAVFFYNYSTVILPLNSLSPLICFGAPCSCAVVVRARHIFRRFIRFARVSV